MENIILEKNHQELTKQLALFHWGYLCLEIFC